MHIENLIIRLQEATHNPAATFLLDDCSTLPSIRQVNPKIRRQIHSFSLQQVKAQETTNMRDYEKNSILVYSLVPNFVLFIYRSYTFIVVNLYPIFFARFDQIWNWGGFYRALSGLMPAAISSTRRAAWWWWWCGNWWWWCIWWWCGWWWWWCQMALLKGEFWKTAAAVAASVYRL